MDNLRTELTFKDVDEGWAADRLGDVVSFKVTNSFSRDNLNYEIGTVKNIHYGDIHTKFNTLFDITKELVPYINPEIDIKKIKEDNYCKEGDVILADASEDLNDVGKSIEIVSLNNEKLVSGLHTILARPKKGLFPKGFIGYLFKSDIIRNQIKKESQGTKVLSISASRLQNIIIHYPFSIIHSKKIASCLSSLDEVISAHTEKLQALKDHKKGLLQNLFPQEGETVPKFRFPEFEGDGEWVEKLLGECLLVKPEYGLNAPAVPYSNDLPTYIRITDISEDGNFLIEGKVSVDRVVSDNDYLCDGDIVLARTGASVGKSYKYRKNDGDLVFAGFLIRVKPNPTKLNSELLFQILTTTKYWDWVQAVSVRSGQPGINGTQYANMPIDLPPTIQEQQKIASCLSAVDELITAQQEKIEQLQQHKKGLMQGLFPKIEN